MEILRRKATRSEMAWRIVAIRDRLDENTVKFGKRFCRTGRAIEDWEQDRRNPDPLAIKLIEQLERRLGI